MPITEGQQESAQKNQFVAAQDSSILVRLIAGPGTGKSRAIEERVRWLLAEKEVPAISIFVVSYTRAAANDLQRRILAYCTKHGVGEGCQVSVTTLHSLALRILKGAGMLERYPAKPNVMDQWELDGIFDAEFAHSSGLTPARSEKVRRHFEAFWSTGQWSPANYVPPDPPISQIELQGFSEFRGPRTQTYSCVLPGEIIRACLDCIDAGVCDPAASLKMEHLIVDEFQDLNPCDLCFIDGFIKKGVSVFVAGDDDQSVYSFRFAFPSGIESFDKEYAGVSDHRLEDCFRCTPHVLEAATSVIQKYPLPNRIPKNLKSLHASSDPAVAGQVHRWSMTSGVQEARMIARSCKTLNGLGMPYSDMLVLLGNKDRLLPTLKAALDGEAVPYEPPSAANVPDDREARMAFSLLRIACDKDDYVAYRTALGVLPHVGVVTCDGIAAAVVRNNLNFRQLFYQPLPQGVFAKRALSSLEEARRVVGMVSDWTGEDVLGQHQDAMLAILRDVYGENAGELWARMVEGLPPDMTLQEVRDYLWADNYRQRAGILEAVYDRLGLEKPAEGLLPERVAVMTMHGAKGLDASIVFVPGLENDIIPGQWRRPYPGLVLEAARLLYVSISRAKAACILSYSQSRLVFGKYARSAPSEFTISTGGRFSHRVGGLTDGEANAVMGDYQNL